MTPRQLEILRLIVKGLCYKEIADQLGTSFETVKRQKKTMLHRFGARSSAQLVYICMKQGFIS